MLTFRRLNSQTLQVGLIWLELTCQALSIGTTYIGLEYIYIYNT